MRASSAVERFKDHSVPIVLFAIVGVVGFGVPAIENGEVTWTTFEITLLVFIISALAGFPYALLIAIGTLPLLSGGIASFAAPRWIGPEAPGSSSQADLRHIIAGVSYALAATVVGAHGIIVQNSLGRELRVLPPPYQPSFLVSGGVLVAVVFVSLQFWRFNAPLKKLSRRRILGTVGLGVLLALSPKVAYWLAWHIFT